MHGQWWWWQTNCAWDCLDENGPASWCDLERVVGKSSVTMQWDPSKPDHLKTPKNVQLREYYSFKGVIYTGVGRNETTGHVWCRRDSGLIYITVC